MNNPQIQAMLELEASILGGVIIRTDTLEELPRLEPDDFHDPRHKAVFTAMRNLESRGHPIDVVTIQAEVAQWAGHDEAVTFAFLGELALKVPTPENACDYARRVRDSSLSRRVQLALGDVLTQGRQNVLTGGELLSAALSALSRIDEDQPESGQTIAQLASKRFKQLEQIAIERARGVTSLNGYPTGVKGLDDKLGGLQPGIVTIVAARPGHGKSSLGLAVADACSASGFGVHVFSLEDTEEAYSDRTLARTSNVPSETLRNADLNRQQCADVTLAAHKLKGRRWLVDGRSGITADEIVRSVRRQRRANATNVVIVDYVQLVKRPSRLNPHEALSEIVTTLADAAKLDRMAYVVMSQLNRQLESRSDKRPQLSDLRESGSLEERAKCVIGVYRGSCYGDATEGVDYHGKWPGHGYEPKGDEWAEQVQLCVLKNSNGRTGTVWGHWDGPRTRMT